MKTSNLCVLATVLSLLWVQGCCLIRPDRMEERIEAETVVGVGPRTGWVRPWCRTGFGARPGEQVPVWFRVVAAQDLNWPRGGREVHLSVVYATGAAPDSSIGITVSPAVAVSGPDGFSTVPLVFRAPVPGSFLIKAQYDDGRAVAISYSAPVNVLSR